MFLDCFIFRIEKHNFFNKNFDGAGLNTFNELFSPDAKVIHWTIFSAQTNKLSRE